MAFISAPLLPRPSSSLLTSTSFLTPLRSPASPAPPHSARPSSPEMLSRPFFIGGNWKSNGSLSALPALLAPLNALPALPSSVTVAIAPPFPYIPAVKQSLSPHYALAAQNCALRGAGAYTGEVTAEMIKDVGCDWVILGHSERRSLPEIRESDEVVGDKVKKALEVGLGVVLCVGEFLEEREKGQTMEVVERQLNGVLGKVKDWSRVVIAYEPVWAIGTGKVATPAQVEETHDEIRKWLAKHVSAQVAESIIILYGGSVNGDNCEELAKLPDVDGFLVGGASLKPEFVKIVESYKVKALAKTH